MDARIVRGGFTTAWLVLAALLLARILVPVRRGFEPKPTLYLGIMLVALPTLMLATLVASGVTPAAPRERWHLPVAFGTFHVLALGMWFAQFWNAMDYFRTLYGNGLSILLFWGASVLVSSWVLRARDIMHGELAWIRLAARGLVGSAMLGAAAFDSIAILDLLGRSASGAEIVFEFYGALLWAIPFGLIAAMVGLVFGVAFVAVDLALVAAARRVPGAR